MISAGLVLTVLLIGIVLATGAWWFRLKANEAKAHRPALTAASTYDLEVQRRQDFLRQIGPTGGEIREAPDDEIRRDRDAGR